MSNWNRSGTIAFGPDHILFVSDPIAGTIFALDIEAYESPGIAAGQAVEGLDTLLASALGISAKDLRLVDLAVHPRTHQIFLAVTRGNGPDAIPLVFFVGQGGDFDEVPLDEVEATRTSLPNKPEEASGSRRQRADPRTMSVTDMAFVDGRVVIAGLSNEEFSSKLRAIPFPFSDVDTGASVEIFHGATDASRRTRRSVRSFPLTSLESPTSWPPTPVHRW